MADLFDGAVCRVCGCTEAHACANGCVWIDDPLLGDLCTNCRPALAVAGLDLSITATGAAHWADITVETWKLATTGDQRLVEIKQRTIGFVEVFGIPLPELVLIEDLLFSPRAARSTGITSMVHGVVRAELLERRIPFMLIPPATLKTYATGSGGASKPDMRMALFKRTGLDLADDNQVDAWYLRALGLDLLGEPVLDLPKDHRRALDKLTLPAGVAA